MSGFEEEWALALADHKRTGLPIVQVAGHYGVGYGSPEGCAQHGVDYDVCRCGHPDGEPIDHRREFRSTEP